MAIKEKIKKTLGMEKEEFVKVEDKDRKSTRLNSSH